MAESDMEKKIRELQRNFGNNALERDALESVLAVCGGDVKAAVAFLTASKDDFVDPGPSQETALPRRYNDLPKGYVPTKLGAARKAERGKGKAVEREELGDGLRAVKRIFFDEGATFMTHMTEYEKNPALYSCLAGLMVYQNVELLASTKGKVLAVALAQGDRALSSYLLSIPDKFSFIDVLRAARLLDMPRKRRALEKRIAFLEERKARPGKLRHWRGRLQEVVGDPNYDAGILCSFTGAMAKRLRAWVRSIPAPTLEYYLLQMPKEPWREFADLTHVRPGDFALPYFLGVVFGADPPPDSSVAQCADIGKMGEAELTAALQQHRIPFSFVRKEVEFLTPVQRAAVAEYETINTVLWWHHELACPAVDDVIFRRLQAGEEPTFPYGKFMERLLYFKSLNAPFYTLLLPMADKALRDTTVPLDPPVMVLGDASYSMDVALRTSCIFSSMLAVLCKADLRFFNSVAVDPPLVPRNAEEVVQVTEQARADGLTAPACALYDLYKLRKKYKYFVVVTDEIENEPYQDTFFAQLFYKYCVEVYPASIVFISFLEPGTMKGRMVQALERFGIQPLLFRLDAKRPDLSKSDAFLGLLSAESVVFPDVIGEMISHWSRTDSAVDALARKALDLVTPSKEQTARTETPLQIVTKVTLAKEEEPPTATAASHSDEGSAQGTETAGPAAADGPSAQVVEALDAGPTNSDLSLLGSTDTQCLVCMENPPDTALVPCGHASFCNACATSVAACPVCRAPVEQVLKIFLS